MEIIMSAPRRGVVQTVLISTRQYPVVHVGPLIHIRYLWARYKSISLMMHTMSNYRGSIEVPRVPWLWWSPRVWLLDSEAHLHSRLPMDTVSSVEALNVYISVRSCVDRARYADVHWCTTSATSATHQQIDTLTIILVTEVIRVAARNISVSCMPLLAETLVSLGVVPLRSLGLRACNTLNSKHL